MDENDLQEQILLELFSEVFSSPVGAISPGRDFGEIGLSRVGQKVLNEARSPLLLTYVYVPSHVF